MISMRQVQTVEEHKSFDLSEINLTDLQDVRSELISLYSDSNVHLNHATHIKDMIDTVQLAIETKINFII